MSKTLPRWDLSDLYEGVDDPKLEKDKQQILKRAQKFQKTFDGHIAKTIATSRLVQAFSEYSKIITAVAKVDVFTGLEFEANKHDHAITSAMQSATEWTAEAQKYLLFFPLAISELPKSALKKLAAKKELASYKHWIEKQEASADHILSEKEEALVLESQLTGRSAFVRLYQEESSKKSFRVPTLKKKLHEPELLSLLHHPKRPLRKEAMKVLTLGIEPDMSRYAFIYNMVMQDVILDTRRRGFELVEDARHLDNEISRDAVNVLTGVVKNYYPLVQDYYNFKKQYLRISSLYDYDRYAPVAKETKTFSFKEAKNIVLTAFESFSPEFRAVAELFFKHNWIDAKPRPGKSGGAFCAYATTDSHPYILMNFTGTMNDVMTLAHELGHGVHAYLARKQSPLHYSWPISIAEIASIFAEMIVFNALQPTLTKQQNFSLHALKVESIIASVFRQIAMFEFERNAFATRLKKEVSVPELNAIWNKEFSNMYGSAVIQSKGSEFFWSIIPHFFHWPFYVYAYAFGDLLTRSLFALYEKDTDGFVTKYLNMLSSGGSLSPDELLRPFGANVEDKKFWVGGMQEIKKLIKETKALA